jgi:Holliday junction resolvasome RuvABC endonuclease subunit
MSKQMKVIGFDPSTSNFGMAQCALDVDTLEVTIENLILTKTESEKLKGVNKQSDDIRRAREIRAGMIAACEGYAIAISEIPFFSPAAYPAANFGAGLTVGVLASCPIPLIQVSPRDVKIAAVGHHQACKEEMMEWAFARYPNANWRTYKRAGKVIPTQDNEHLADAVATVLAGIKTQQFQQVLAMYRTLKVA